MGLSPTFTRNSVNRSFLPLEKRQPSFPETARTAGGSDRPGARKAPGLSPASSFVLASSAKRGANPSKSPLWGWDSTQPRRGAHSGLCGANTGHFGWRAITTLGSCYELLNVPGAGIRIDYFPVHALCPSPAGMNPMPSFSAFAFAFCCAAASSAFTNCRS